MISARPSTAVEIRKENEEPIESPDPTFRSFLKTDKVALVERFITDERVIRWVADHLMQSNFPVADQYSP